MSFLRKNTHNAPYIYTIKKEKDSLLATHFPLICYEKKERTSVFTSSGSITLEAALVVPIFFFAMLSMVCLLEMMSIQTTMRNALHSAGKEIAQQAYNFPVISTYGIEQHVIKNVGIEKLDSNIIANGTEGIDCSKSKSDWSTGVIDLSVCYKLNIPILMFRIPIISCEETLRVKGWTGYAQGAEGMEKDAVVYITDYGLVYHKDMSCTYLELSIQAVKTSEIENLRSESGAKYYPCESCGIDTISANRVYITDYGTRYHTSLECSKIKRNIYAVPLDKAYGLGGCSKCVQ